MIYMTYENICPLFSPLIHLPSSHPLFPLREEAYSSHVPTPDWPEPHRGGHRWDECQGGRAATPVLGLWGGHDPPAAQTARQHQCSGTNDDGVLLLLLFLNYLSVIDDLRPPCFSRSMLVLSPTPEPSSMTAVPRNSLTTRSNSSKRCSGTSEWQKHLHMKNYLNQTELDKNKNRNTITNNTYSPFGVCRWTSLSMFHGLNCLAQYEKVKWTIFRVRGYIVVIKKDM